MKSWRKNSNDTLEFQFKFFEAQRHSGLHQPGPGNAGLRHAHHRGAGPGHPQPIKDAAWEALNRGCTHYAPNQGTPALRQAVAEYETRRGNPVNPAQVLITVGSSQALFTALLGILNPGEEVIVPIPAFSLYESIITAAGGKVVPLDVSKTGFQITREALDSLITEKTKAIILNSPNNPTGVVLNEESLAAVKAAVLGKPIFWSSTMCTACCATPPARI